MALSPLIKVPLATVCCQSAGLKRAGQGRLLTQGPHTERQSPSPSVHPGRVGPGLEEEGRSCQQTSTSLESLWKRKVKWPGLRGQENGE